MIVLLCEKWTVFGPSPILHFMPGVAYAPARLLHPLNRRSAVSSVPPNSTVAPSSFNEPLRLRCAAFLLVDGRDD
jgi:hypothetical protein